MSIIVIDNYDSFTYNLYQLLKVTSDQDVLVIRNDKVTLEQLNDLAPSRIVLSPGPGHPANEADFGICKSIISEFQALRSRPSLLGICLGHQGIVHHLGGTVRRAPEIAHGTVSDITVIDESPLFRRIDGRFRAMRYHSLVAEEGSLPEMLKVTARDSRGQLVMAVTHKTLPMYGIQFHPESFGTPVGRTIIENFLSS